MEVLNKSNFIKGVAFTVLALALVVGGFVLNDKMVLAADSDIVYIPDEDLKEYINDELGVDDLSADITEGQMKELTELDLYWIEDRLTDITGIGYCTNLTSLKMTLCGNVIDFSEIGKLTNLTTLDLRATEITDFSILKNLTKLTELDLEDTAITDLSQLEHLTNLTSLSLEDCVGITDVSKLGALTKLTYLSLSSCNGIKNVSGLGTLKNLNTLRLEECEKLTDISELGKLTNLVYLYMSKNSRITDISELGKMTSLAHLYMEDCVGIKDISSLGDLENLMTLKINDCPGIEDISSLASLTKLDTLEFSSCRYITDISVLENFKNLKRLRMWGCRKISDLSVLSNLTNLTYLDIGYIREEGEYTEAEKNAISSLVNLEYLFIYGNNLYNEDTVLFDKLSKVHYLALYGNHITDFSFLSKLPNLKMSSSYDDLGHTFVNIKEYLPLETTEYVIKNDVKDINGNYVAPNPSTIYDYNEETKEIIVHVDKLTSAKNYIRYDFKVTTSKGEKLRILHSKILEIKYLYEIEGTLEKYDEEYDYVVGDYITLRASATGGNEDYKYKFAIMDVNTGRWSVLQDFSDDYIYSYKFVAPGKKKFAVTIKDTMGNTVATNRIEVNVNKKLSAKLTVDGGVKALTKVKGSKITLTPVVTGGRGGYLYKFAVLNVDTGKWSVLQDFSEASTYTYALNYPGRKQFVVSVMDSDWNIVSTNRITVDVYKKMSAKLTVDGSTKELTKAKGSQITLTPVVTGGMDGYTYKFAVLNVNTGKWSILKDFSDTNTYTYALNYPGKKQFVVTVKDSVGNTVSTNRISVTVK